jgi:formylglycine-generating enzyme required for sulfatase activity
MGSGAATWSKSEVPAHQVTLTRGFFLGVHELSWGAYTRFCRETGRALPPRTIADHLAGDDEPVFNVTWDDARAYCAWAGLRLPTEAEWEYASRSGRDTAIRPWTDEFHTEGRCNMKTGDPYPATSPAGAFAAAATPWGCQDMAGNVSEWVQDAWSDYTAAPQADPVVHEGSTRHVIRSGNWTREDWTMRCAWRGVQDANDREPFTGFRVARGP